MNKSLKCDRWWAWTHLQKTSNHWWGISWPTLTTVLSFQLLGYKDWNSDLTLSRLRLIHWVWLEFATEDSFSCKSTSWISIKQWSQHGKSFLGNLLEHTQRYWWCLFSLLLNLLKLPLANGISSRPSKSEWANEPSAKQYLRSSSLSPLLLLV